VDVGYYAPAARTTLNRVFLCACLSARLAQSPSTSPSTPSLGIDGCVPPPGCGYPSNPTTFGAVRGEVRRWLDLQASGAVFILCNGEREDEGRQGVTHATCRSTGAPTPTVRRRTAVAFVVRRHCDTSEPARQTHSGGAAGRSRPYVGSRFSLKQRPRFLCGGMASAQGFLSTWSLEPTAIPEEVGRVVVSSPAPPGVLGAAADRTPPPGAGAPGASTKDKPANDRPSPRSVLVHTSTHSPAAPGWKTSFYHCERQAGWPPVARRRRLGASPIQSQRICLMLLKHMTALRQGAAPRAPEVMLDDAVQAHPGRLRLRRR